MIHTASGIHRHRTAEIQSSLTANKHGLTRITNWPYGAAFCPPRNPYHTSNFQRIHLPTFTGYWQTMPSHQRFVRSEMTKDYQTLPKMTEIEIFHRLATRKLYHFLYQGQDQSM